MTTHEDHPQLIVSNPIRPEGPVHCGGERPLAIQVDRKVGSELPAGPLPPNRIDRPTTGRRHEPGLCVVGNTATRPLLQGSHERILHHGFGELEILWSQDSRQY